ncbi:MAG: hypothetical protein AAF745_18765 [Planctomycetota bacterium]
MLCRTPIAELPFHTTLLDDLFRLIAGSFPMRPMNLFAALTLAAMLQFQPSSIHAASPTGWSPVILPTGSYRTQIKSLPIENRPGRPLHVYGNTIRMMDQANRVTGMRPVRQIFFGTPELRGMRAGSRRR